MEGPWDEKTKTMSLKGKMVDPTHGKSINIRQEVKIIDDNHLETTQYTEKDGKEFKSMFIVQKRKM